MQGPEAAVGCPIATASTEAEAQHRPGRGGVGSGWGEGGLGRHGRVEAGNDLTSTPGSQGSLQVPLQG